MEFNQDVSAWDVSSVQNMQTMFQAGCSGEYKFDQDLSAWDVSNVGNLDYMLHYTTKFDQDLSAWDVSKATMQAMFHSATSFSQKLC